MESHPLECFIKANENGLSDLRDKAALRTLDMKAEDVLSALKHSTVIFTAWVIKSPFQSIRLVLNAFNSAGVV